MTCMLAGVLILICGAVFLGAGDFALGGFLLLLGTLFSIVGYGDWSTWRYRVDHLCRDCSAVEQPARRKDGGWKCAACGATRTIPMDSPFAKTIVKHELEQLERSLQ